MDAPSDQFRDLGPDRFAQIRRIFEAASELSSDARASYLDTACGEDVGLRMEVEVLLEAAERNFPILDRPALELQSALSIPEPTAATGLVGTALSHYRLLSRL